MRIGELARRLGTSTRTLRHYEQQGLLEARRSANGYRDYDERDARVVAEIRALQEFGFALDDTRPFVECLQAGHPAGDACPDAIAVYRRKIAELDAYVGRLTELRDRLDGQLVAALERRAACAPTPCPTAEETPCHRP